MMDEGRRKKTLMPVVKMHTDELDIDAAQVRRLLAAQFPQWAGLPIEPVVSAGTVNALFRLGQDMAVRLPRIHWAVKDVEKNHHWCRGLLLSCRWPSQSRLRRVNPVKLSLAVVGFSLAGRRERHT